MQSGATLFHLLCYLLIWECNTTEKKDYSNNIFIAALGLPGWMGLDRSATVAIVLALVLLTAALGTAYKLYYCRRNRELRNDELRTANTGQYHGM